MQIEGALKGMGVVTSAIRKIERKVRGLTPDYAYLNDPKCWNMAVRMPNLNCASQFDACLRVCFVALSWKLERMGYLQRGIRLAGQKRSQK